MYKNKILIFIVTVVSCHLEINFILKWEHTFKNDVCLSYKEEKELTGSFVHAPGHEHTSSSSVGQSC